MALERLFGLERGGGRLGLGGTRQLLEALGSPELEFASAHVGGTNGKGSTAVYLERLLRAAGLRTGLYTSPHLVDFRERIRIEGRTVSPADLLAALERLEALPAARGRTFFEAATALAFERFAAERVQVVVAEVGLGGRLDCTNVLHPAVVALAPVALDHTELLGPTLREVAAEKGGILKPGIPAVMAAQAPVVRAVLERMAAEQGAPLYRVGDLAAVRSARLTPEGTEVSLRTRDFGTLRFRLRALGRHQAENAALAVAAFSTVQDSGLRHPSGVRLPLTFRPTPATIETALGSARWPGRLAPSDREPRLWWDGAHNPHGARALVRAWRAAMGSTPTTLVFGVSSDKPLGALVRALDGPWVSAVATQSENPRAVPAQELAAAAERQGWTGVRAVPGVGEAVTEALRTLPDSGRVLVAGSLFVVGEAMRAVGEDPTKDLP